MNRGREECPHVGIYGRCNVGKSSVINFITEQNVAIVSPQRGTTTDPVRKSYEIQDFAPVIFIDTAGFDDDSELGANRTRRSQDTLSQIDLALVVFCNNDWSDSETRFADHLKHESIPFVIVHNKFNPTNGLSNAQKIALTEKYNCEIIEIDALTGNSAMRDQLLKAIVRSLPEKSYKIPSMFEGDVEQNDLVMLVCPIDSEAPAGRLILPQVRAIRDLLDIHAVPIVVQPEEVAGVIARGIVPKLVITDSQMFAEVKAVVPAEVKVTSFSILLARMKGDYKSYQAGLAAIDKLVDGDAVLILENCTHQSSCDDIGRVKIPRWLSEYSGAKLKVDVISGLTPLPDDLSKYALVLQCGGCMVTRSQLQNRIRTVVGCGIPITNYGMAIEKLRMTKK